MSVNTGHGTVSYLGLVNSSSKLIKGLKKNVETYGIYLAPHNLSGFQVCPNSTTDCRNFCLFSSGRSKFDAKIPKARITKTKMLFEQPEKFGNIMRKEINNASKLAAKKGHDFVLRMNLTSDISPEDYAGVNLLKEYSHLKFYDYSKSPKRLELLKKYANYFLTFSYDGFEKTWKTCEEFLQNNGNVSVVFYPEIPKTFKKYKVIDGDLDDLRYLDERGCIVGLKYKRTKNDNIEKIMNNRFIVKTVLNKLTNEYEVI
jgi:hypothetical protein